MQQPTCETCQKYYDPHTASGYGNNERGKCVWVPHESKCYAKKMAEENNWAFDETCSGSLDNILQKTLNTNFIVRLSNML